MCNSWWSGIPLLISKKKTFRKCWTSKKWTKKELIHSSNEFSFHQNILGRKCYFLAWVTVFKLIFQVCKKYTQPCKYHIFGAIRCYTYIFKLRLNFMEHNQFSYLTKMTFHPLLREGFCFANSVKFYLALDITVISWRLDSIILGKVTEKFTILFKQI